MNRPFQVALALAACSLIALLASQNKTLRDQRDGLMVQNASPRIGLSIATFSAVDANGKELIFGQDINLPALIVFMDPNCSYCTNSIEALNDLYRNRPRSNFFGIIRTDKDLLSAYTSKNEVEFPVLYTSDGGIVNFYNVYGTPVIVLVDRSSKIVYSRFGVLNRNEDVAVIRDLLTSMQ